jgi:hypothetical protein
MEVLEIDPGLGGELVIEGKDVVGALVEATADEVGKRVAFVLNQVRGVVEASGGEIE